MKQRTVSPLPLGIAGMIPSEQTNATTLNTLHGVRHSLLSSSSSTCSWVAPLDRCTGDLFSQVYVLSLVFFCTCVSVRRRDRCTCTALIRFCVSCLVLLDASPHFACALLRSCALCCSIALSVLSYFSLSVLCFFACVALWGSCDRAVFVLLSGSPSPVATGSRPYRLKPRGTG